MKIAICSSMAFAKDMIKTAKDLRELGHKVTIQNDVEDYAQGIVKQESKWEKIEFDPFKTYFKEIKKCDAIIVINKDKNNIKGYIGGNTLIEMAFAYVLNKKIFLLNQIPKMAYTDEVEVMKPVVINNDLTLIK